MKGETGGVRVRAERAGKGERERKGERMRETNEGEGQFNKLR
jgi:hypothetical protein